jgi:regulatory protein
MARRARHDDSDPGSGPHADPDSVARTIVLTKLAAQPRSRAELADLLAKRHVPDDVAQRVLDRSEEVGLVDDAAFARAWVESRQASRGLARRALAQELRRRGVEDNVARGALDGVDPGAEEEAARVLVRRRLRSMRSVSPEARVRRLTAMLARKGYTGAVVFRVVREEIEASGVEPGDLDLELPPGM